MTDRNAAAACTTGCASTSEGNCSSSAICRIRPLEPGCSAWDAEVSSDRATRLSHDLKRRATEHAGDDEADDDVRPRRAAEPDGQRGEQDGHVRDDVVAGAQPGRTHIDIVAAMPPEQDETDDVGGERGQ